MPRFEKYADRLLGAFSYRFNRRFNLAAMNGACGSCHLQLFKTAGTTPEVVRSLLPNSRFGMSCFCYR